MPYRPQALGGEHVADEPALAFNIDREGTITYVHQSLPDWSADEITESPVLEHFPGDQHDTLRQAIDRVFAKGEGRVWDCRGFLPFEPSTWFHCRLAPNLVADEVASATLVLRDISRWKDESVESAAERDRLRGEVDAAGVRAEILETQRARHEEEVAKLTKDIARLTIALRERDDEVKKSEHRAERDREARQDLLSEVERLKLLLEYREDDYQEQTTQQIVEQATQASVVAEHTTRWHRAERQLEDERVRFQAELDRLNDELDKQTYWLDRKDRERDRLRLILDQAAEAMLIVNASDGTFVDANDTACRWLRHTREKLVTLTVDDVGLEFSLDTDEERRAHVVDTRKGKRSHVVRNATVRRRDGSTFMVEVAISHAKIGDHEYRLLVARDANKRKQIEDAQRESEERFRNAFDLSMDAMYLSARDGTVADANPAALTLFGYTREEIVGLDASRLYENADHVRRFQEIVGREGVVRRLGVVLQTKTGVLFPAELTSTFHHTGDGEPVGYQCIVRPVSPGGDSELSVAPAPVTG